MSERAGDERDIERQVPWSIGDPPRQPEPRVELHQDGRELVATYTLKDGVAVREGGPDWLDSVRIIEPGDPPVEVHPADGERYLRGLLIEFSGTRLRARVSGAEPAPPTQDEAKEGEQ